MGREVKLFVYGIFLAESHRLSYGMSNPKYATVRGYATRGHHIVEAVKDDKYTLTGLLVDVDPRAWKVIDRLERGYDRVEIETTLRERAYMYVGKERI